MPSRGKRSAAAIARRIEDGAIRRRRDAVSPAPELAHEDAVSPAPRAPAAAVAAAQRIAPEADSPALAQVKLEAVSPALAQDSLGAGSPAPESALEVAVSPAPRAQISPDAVSPALASLAQVKPVNLKSRREVKIQRHQWIDPDDV